MKTTKRLYRTLCGALVLACAGACAGANVCTNAHDLLEATRDARSDGMCFDLVATCTWRQSDKIFFADATGAMCADSTSNGCGSFRPQDVYPGDRLRLRGLLRPGNGLILAHYTNLTFVGWTSPPAVRTVTGREFLSGRCDYRPVSVTGRISEIVPDEIDSNYQFLSIQCGDRRILTPLAADETNLTVGARVSAQGICIPATPMSRSLVGRLLFIPHAHGSRITVLAGPEGSPFDAPLLQKAYGLQPEEIFHLTRRRTVGRVDALWRETKVLVTAADGQFTKVTLAKGPLPRIGETVEVAGMPETDLFRINLAKALWRPREPALPVAETSVTNVTVGDIVRSVGGNAIYSSDLDGACVRLAGTVRQLPPSLGLDPRLYLDCDSRLVAIDLTAAPQATDGIPVDSRVEVTGICLMETEAWQPNMIFPRVTGFTVAIRRPGDIRLVAPPPFWTVRRLFVVIAVLALLLLSILTWNRSLRVLASRRGHQLFREQVAHYEAVLRVDERTKLAVELHDSLAQNLTGAFMELQTAESLGAEAKPEMLRHLEIAAATVKSCHGELRNCLWDLRNLSLEEQSLDAALRKTLAPHVRGLAVAIRFNVPRSRLTDNTTHAILRIVRELVLNAIRHGGATKIQIAGCIDGDRLLFSVRDNGCGFDPDASPGIAQGHFGLEGIRERAGLLAGTLEIDSAPGAGTRATVTLHLPSADARKKT